MNKKVLFTATLVVAALAMLACSKSTSKVEVEAKKEPARAPEAITAQRAFYEMYKPARAWATDLLALSVISGEVPNVDCHLRFPQPKRGSEVHLRCS
jgi:hypothetical protein